MGAWAQREAGRQQASTEGRLPAADSLLATGVKSPRLRGSFSPAHRPLEDHFLQPRSEAGQRKWLPWSVGPEVPWVLAENRSALQSLSACLVAEPRSGPDFPAASFWLNVREQAGAWERPGQQKSFNANLDDIQLKSDVISPESSALVGWVGTSCLA